MAFARPTLAELVTRIRADYRGRLSFVSPLVRRAMADVMAAVWAGGVHQLHGHLVWAARQLFPDTSERDSLLRQSSMYGIYPSEATYSSGLVEAAGEDGSPIPTDSFLVRSDGVRYRVTADAEIASGTAEVAVEAVEAGAAGDLAAGETLVFESPLDGVDSSVTVIGLDGLSGGHDEELTEGTRDRLLLRLREPPTGGSDQDYEGWALAVPGITRAWVYRHENGLGTVVVRFVNDGEVDIFPDVGTVAAVQAKLDSERPTTAEVLAAAPTPLDLDLELAIVPDTTATRAAVTAELTDLLRRNAAPGDGDERGTILLSDLETSVRNAEGVTDRTVISPASDRIPGVGELFILGTITWS